MFSCSHSPFGDVSGGEAAAGENTVREFSRSSLKLKLFLFSDSAPVTKRERTRGLERAHTHTHTHREKCDVCQWSSFSV